jgi:hypothetical protein
LLLSVTDFIIFKQKFNVKGLFRTEVGKGDSVAEDLRLRWRLDLGIQGENKTSKRAEAVFRKNQKDQTENLLLRPGSRIRAIVKHVLHRRPSFLFPKGRLD